VSSKRQSNPWQTVTEYLRDGSTGMYATYAKHSLSHPRQVGARVTASLPVGQIADYRFGPETGCMGLHVQEYERHWAARIDQAQNTDGSFSDLAPDTLAARWVTCALLGAAAGAALGRKSGAVLAGAGIGLLVAALISPKENR